MEWFDLEEFVPQVVARRVENGAGLRLATNGSITFLASGGFAGLTYPWCGLR